MNKLTKPYKNNIKGWGFIMTSVLLNVLNKETTERMDYIEVLCWLHENYGDDLLLTSSEEYKRFCESEDEDDEMDMKVTNTEEISKEGIFGADIYNDEDSFVSAQITGNENDLLLKLNIEGIVKDYVLLYA